MKIIAFTGMPFSGKSEAVAVARERGYSVFRMGDLVWEETKKRKQPLDDEHVGTVASEMRMLFGKDIWSRRMIEKIQKKSTSEILVIDGIRNIEEVNRFKKDLSGDFFLIGINVLKSLRHERAQSRRRIDDATNPTELNQRDKREKQWGINKVISAADYLIDNNNDLESFKHEIHSFFDQLEKR